MAGAKEVQAEPLKAADEKGDGRHATKFQHGVIRHQGEFSGMANAYSIQLCGVGDIDANQL